MANSKTGLTDIQTPSTTNGPEMTSTNRTPISTRVSQCLAATALMAGLAIAAASVATAEPEWDIEVYDKCIERGTDKVSTCCIVSGGEWNTAEGKCQAPAPLQNQPGQTVAPPVLENPRGQTVAPPVISAPRGPNSGTLG